MFVPQVETEGRGTILNFNVGGDTSGLWCPLFSLCIKLSMSTSFEVLFPTALAIAVAGEEDSPEYCSLRFTAASRNFSLSPHDTAAAVRLLIVSSMARSNEDGHWQYNRERRDTGTRSLLHWFDFLLVIHRNFLCS